MSRASVVILAVAIVGGAAFRLVQVHAGSKSVTRREVNRVGFGALRSQVEVTEEGNWWLEWIVGGEQLNLREGFACSWTTSCTTSASHLLPRKLKMKWKEFSTLQVFGRTVGQQVSFGFSVA
jgi:hypothetical protein